jgi:hypothetical protein
MAELDKLIKITVDASSVNIAMGQVSENLSRSEKDVDKFAKAIERSVSKMKDLGETTDQAATKTKNLTDKTGLAGAALVEIGRTISDANYGWTAMANNLSQLSTLMVTLIATTGGLAKGLAALGRAFLGPLGLIVVFQVVIALIERFALGNKKAAESMSSMSKSAQELGIVINGYLRQLNDVNTSEEERRVLLSRIASKSSELKDIIKENKDNLVDLNAEIVKYIKVQSLRAQLDDEIKKADEAKLKLDKLAQTFRADDVKQMRQYIAELSFFPTWYAKLTNQMFSSDESIRRSFKSMANVALQESDAAAAKVDTIVEALSKIDTTIEEENKKRNSIRLATFKQNLFDLSSEIEKYRQDSLEDANLNALEIIEQERGFAIAALDVKKKQFVDEEVLRKENYVKQLDERRTQAKEDDKWTEQDEENYRRLKLEADETLKVELLEAEAEFNDAMLMLNEAFNTQLQIQNDKQLDDAFNAFKVSRDATREAEQKYIEQSQRNETARLEKQEEHRQENFERDKAYLQREIELRKERGEIVIALEEDLHRLEVENTRKAEEAKIAIRKATLTQIADNIDKSKEYVQALSDFINADFEAQSQKEQNKTNAINNELRARLANENLSKEEKEKINQQIAANDEKLRIKQEEIEKKRFKTDKAFRISMALMDTASAALKAYVSQLSFDPTSPIRAALAAAAATALGLAQVAMISKQQFQSSASSTPPSVSAGSAAGAETSVQAPDFNVVGQSNVSQLAQLVQAQLDKPFKTYVVAKDVTTAQELDRNRVSAATI